MSPPGSGGCERSRWPTRTHSTPHGGAGSPSQPCRRSAARKRGSSWCARAPTAAVRASTWVRPLSPAPRCACTASRLPPPAVGTSYVLGTDLEHARLAAIFDGLLSDAGQRERVLAEVVAPLEREAGRARWHSPRRGAQHARRLLHRRQGARMNAASPVSANSVSAFHAPGFADPDPRRAARVPRRARRGGPPRRALFPLAGPAEPPAALGRGLAAVALTLLDEDCAVWLGGHLALTPRSPPGLRFTPGCGA